MSDKQSADEWVDSLHYWPSERCYVDPSRGIKYSLKGFAVEYRRQFLAEQPSFEQIELELLRGMVEHYLMDNGTIHYDDASLLALTVVNRIKQLESEASDE